MANHKIDNEIFVTTLRIRKSNNGADLDSIDKEMKKYLYFEDVTKEFLDDRMHSDRIHHGSCTRKTCQLSRE